MRINFDIDTPVYLQVADELSNAIMIGAFLEESQIPSVAELSLSLNINPATALKGVNVLVDGGIVYKKRGLGMFVAPQAKQRLVEQRTNKFYSTYITTVVEEAKRLGISRQQVSEMILKGENYE